MVRVRLVLAVLLSAGAGAAQEGPEWDLQRCVWACQRNFGQGDTPATNACITDQCMAPAKSPAWSSGINADGTGRYAGVVDPGLGHNFYFLCWPGGQSYLMLTGPEGPDAVLPVTVAGQTYAVPFTSYGGYVMTPISVDSPIIAGIWQGGTLSIVNSAGYSLGTFSLDGAPLAIHTAWQGCQ